MIGFGHIGQFTGLDSNDRVIDILSLVKLNILQFYSELAKDKLYKNTKLPILATLLEGIVLDGNMHK